MCRLSAEAMVMSQPIQKREFVTGIFQFPEWMRYRLELVFQLTVSGTPGGGRSCVRFARRVPIQNVIESEGRKEGLAGKDPGRSGPFCLLNSIEE